MTNDRELAARIVNLLNEVCETDRGAIDALVSHRVPCNESLAEHPTVQVGPALNDVGPDVSFGYVVGLCGILNGLCGVDENGWGLIAYVQDEEGRIVRFRVRDGANGRDS